MKVLPVIVVGALTQALAMGADGEMLGRLRQWVAASPIGQATADAPLTRSLMRMRDRLAVIGGTLEQAARRSEAGHSPAEELQVLGLLLADFERARPELEGKLPDEAWRSQYRTRIGAISRQLSSLRASRRPTGIELRRVAGSIAGLFADHADVGLRSQFVMREDHPARLSMAADPAQAVPVRATTAPGQAETGEDNVVLLTPEIRQRAESLGNDPARIFAWVHNNVETEFQAGALQNSLAALWARRAGATDQATLLIALLRAAGIPSRYVFGTIRITAQQLADWVGAKNPTAGIYIANQVFAFAVSADNIATIDHVWVEAFVDGDWVSLDPSFKTHDYQPGLKIPVLPFERDAYLASVKTRAAGEVYQEQLRQYLRENNPGVALSDLAYAGPIRAVAEDKLPAALPYSVTRVIRRAASLERGDMHRVVLTLRAPGGTTYFTKELLFPEICMKALSVSSMAPGGAASPLAGGAFRPQLYADNSVIAEGQTALPANTRLELLVEYYRPTDTAPIAATRGIAPGTLVGVPLYNFHGSEYLKYRSARLLALAPATAGSAEVLRELLHITGMRYLQVWSEAGDNLTRPLQLTQIYWRGQFGFTTTAPTTQTFLNRPFPGTPGQLGMDIQGAIGLIADLNVGNAGSAAWNDFRRVVGLTGSFLEHEVVEQLALGNAVSTVKVFQLAGEERVPLVTIARANAASAVAALPYTDAQKAELMSRFANPQIASIVVPARSITVAQVRLFAYVYENVQGSGGYIIEGSAGGFLLQLSDGSFVFISTGDPTSSGGFGAGDPVNVANGNMFLQAVDLALPGRGLPIQVVRTYNSQSAAIGPFGLGWTHNFNLSLRVTASSAEVTNATGGTLVLPKQGTDYLSAVRFGLRLRQDGTDYVLRHRAGLQWRFDAQGRLREVADANGNKQTLAYDGAGRLSSITDPAGRPVTLTYDGRGRITALQDYGGRRRTYDYDSADHLTAVTSAEYRTTYSYYGGSAAAQNLRTVTYPDGATTTFFYYANDKIFKTVDAGGGETLFIYLPLRRTTVAVDERGFPTTFEYDEEGRVTRITDPEGNSKSAHFDANGQMLEATDEAGSPMRFEYDAQGNLIRVTDALGSSLQYAYEPTFNRVTSVTDPRANVSRLEYDQRGNLVKYVDAAGTSGSFSYDAFGSLTGVTDGEGNATAFASDDKGLLTETKDPLGFVSRIENDTLGRAVRITNALGDAGSLEYDSLGRLGRTVSPLGRQVTFVRDTVGHLTQVTDANQNSTNFAFDVLDNLTSAATPTGETANYSYASPECPCPAVAGLMASAGNSAGAGSAFTYNHRGQIVSRRDASGKVSRVAYEGRGNPVEVIYQDDSFIRFSYDANNRVVERVRSDGARETFSYDAAGNILTASNPVVTYTYTYNERNFVSTVQDSRFQGLIRYEYDRIGRLAKTTDPRGGVTEYSYDRRGLLATIRNPAGLTTIFSYDAARRRSEVAFGNGTKARYEWDSDSRLVSLTYTAGDSVLNQFRYEYDAAGNRVAVTDATGRHEYRYDASNRLVGAAHPDQPAESYTYDSVGNRVSSHRDSQLVYDAGNRLTNAGDAGLTYDPRGSLAVQGPQKLSYNTLGNLNRVDNARGVILYRYDPFGRRVEKSVNGVVTRYLYDGQMILQEYDGSGRVTARFTNGPGIDEPLIMERDGNGNGAFEPNEGYFYQRDGLGSIRALATAAGGLAEQYQYDSFGNFVKTDAARPTTVGNPYFFTAREWDSEIGFYYYRARHYDPAYGRFLQEDDVWNPAVPFTLNGYSYTYNNPLRWVDPSGQTPGIPNNSGYVPPIKPVNTWNRVDPRRVPGIPEPTTAPVVDPPVNPGAGGAVIAEEEEVAAGTRTWIQGLKGTFGEAAPTIAKETVVDVGAGVTERFAGRILLGRIVGGLAAPELTIGLTVLSAPAMLGWRFADGPARPAEPSHLVNGLVPDLIPPQMLNALIPPSNDGIAPNGRGIFKRR